MARKNGRSPLNAAPLDPSPGTGANDVPGGNDGSARTLEPSRADAARRAACSAMSGLLLRDDGWLRATPDGDGKALYLKWKFTRGRFTGYYVMAVCEVWNWDHGLAVLLDKVEQCDLDIRRPTKDTPYEWRE